MRTVRTIFNEVAVWRTERFACPGCGKRRSRRVKFYQTLNPYNIWRASEGGDGRPKSRERIRAEIKAQAAAWKPICAGCDADAKARKGGAV